MEVVAHPDFPVTIADSRIIPDRGDFAVVYAGVSFVGDKRCVQLSGYYEADVALASCH